MRLGLLDLFRRGIPAGFYGNLGWQYVTSVWSMGMGFVYAIVVGRWLGAAEYGVMALGLGFTSVVFQCVELRLHEPFIRFVTQFWEDGEYAKVLATVKASLLLSALTALTAFGVVAALAPWARTHLIRDPRGITVAIVAAASVVFTNLGVATSTGLYRVLRAYRTQAVISVATSSLKLAATVAAILGPRWGVVPLLAVNAGASALTSAGLLGGALANLHRQIPWRVNSPLSLLRPHLPEMRRFVRSMYVLSLLSIPTKDLDVNVLGWFTTSAVVGVYRIAKNFMLGIWAVLDPVFFVIYPELAKMWARRQFGELRRFAKRISLLMGVTGLVLCCGAMLVVPLVIRRLMGPQFAEATTLFRAMVWGVIFWGPIVWGNPLLLAAGRPDLSVRAGLAGGLGVVALYLVCIPLWGGTGAAVAYALATPLTMAWVFFLGRRAGLIFPPVELTGGRA